MLMKSEHRKELVSEIRSLAQSQGLNTVFTTFLEITANSLAAQTDPENAEKRERRYQEMASTMTPELLSSYARMLALLFLTVREYRDDPCDILGGIYHELNLNNEWNGQYFTPDDVCRLMAQITLPSDELSANDGPITINEPTCGSGTMVIGAIWAMQRKEFDYRHNTFFVAQDIDIRCVWMAYTFHGRQLFTEEEIRQIAAIYEAANSDNRDGIRKSRNRSFDVGEFGRWIMNGMKTAHTMEEYRACGNTVVVVEYAEPVWKKHVVYTTKQLLDKLCELDGKPISVSFWDNRTVMHPPIRRKNDSLNHNELSEYYVLRADQGFFVKRSSRRIWFARKIPPTAASVRKFRTEKAAQRYLDDNAKFFAKIAFQIEHIQNGGDAI